MKSWKTTLAGLVAGLPVIFDALITAYTSGAFTGKSGLELVGGIGIVVFGVIAKDHNVTGTGTATKVLLPLIAVMGLSTATNAQSMFSAIPKPVAPKVNMFARSLTIVDTPAAGSDYTGFRFTGPTVMYMHTVNGGAISQSALGTFIGIDFENYYFNPADRKFYSRYAIGAHVGEGGEFAPTSVSAVTLLAGSISTQKIGNWLLPFKLTVAFIYNLTTKSPMLGTGPGIPLNN